MENDVRRMLRCPSLRNKNSQLNLTHKVNTFKSLKMYNFYLGGHLLERILKMVKKLNFLLKKQFEIYIKKKNLQLTNNGKEIVT